MRSVVVKSASRFLLARSGWVLLTWILFTVFIVAATWHFGIYEKIRQVDGDFNVSIGLLLFPMAAGVLSLSLPVAGLALLILIHTHAITATIQHILPANWGMPELVPYMTLLSATPTLTSALMFRTVWKNSRNGPSEAPLGRLLEGCLNRSFYAVLYPTLMTIIFFMSACLADSPMVQAVAVSVVASLAHSILYVTTLTPAVYIVKQKHSSHLLSLVSRIAVVGNMRSTLSRLSHRAVKIGQKGIIKCRSIFALIFLGHFLLSAFFVCYEASRRQWVKALAYPALERKVAAVAAAVNSPGGDEPVPSSRSIPLVLLCVSLAAVVLLRNAALVVCTLILSLSAFLSTQLVAFVYPPVSTQCAVFAVCLQLDAAIRACVVFRKSHRKKRASRAFEALELVCGGSLVFAYAGVVAFGAVLLVDGSSNQSKEIVVSFLLVPPLVFIQTSLYLPPLLMILGPSPRSGFCYGKKDARDVEPRRSDAFSSGLPDVVDTRRFSSANYQGGMYKKRHSLAHSDIRRASMPVVVGLATNRKSPRTASPRAGKLRGMSMDAVTLNSQKTMLKREPLLNSQLSLCSSIGSRELAPIQALDEIEDTLCV